MKRQRSLETIGILSSGIAHDFNNLLVTIIGNADLALRKLDHNSPAYNHLRHIKTASVRASSLTGQLLAYAGNGTITREPVDLNDVVEDMAALFSAALPTRISMTFRFAEESPVVLANKLQVRQVVMNLITNAIDAVGDSDGEIILSTGSTDCVDGGQPESEHGYAVLEVTDSGSGIPDEVCEQMFEPFFTTKPSGRGLGLAIVSDHVGRNGGRIQALNRTDGCTGAKFTVWFPMTDLPVVSDSKDDELPTSTPQMTGTVLVIDDEEDVRDTTAAMLEDAGFHVITAATGHEGVSVFEHNPSAIDLVLVDMTLPSQDGYEVAKELKQAKPGIPVIMSSGYSADDSQGDKGSDTIDAFLRKPYHMTALLQAVNAVMHNHAT